MNVICVHSSCRGSQASGPLVGKLTPGVLHHLQRTHPAIDEVGVFPLVTDPNEKYLVLLQVSVSSYDRHSSKAMDILGIVSAMEFTAGECSARTVSIARCYQDLVELDAECVVPQQLYSTET